MKVSIATTSLISIPTTSVVAVRLVASLVRNYIAAPALIYVLHSRKGIILSCAPGDAFIDRIVRVVAVELNLQLSARIVLLPTSIIAVDSGAICIQGTNLLSNGTADKLDELLPKVRIAGIHGPHCSAVVGINIYLRLRNGTVEICSC